MSEPTVPPARSRNIGVIHSEADDSTIIIDHVYAAEGSFSCEDCGRPGHDPGVISMLVSESDEEDSPVAHAWLTPADALLVANRLTRAANLILESREDVPDFAREAARLAVPGDPSGEA